MHRLAAPEEIADTILFLAYSKSSFATGGMLTIDGGMTTCWGTHETRPIDHGVGAHAEGEGGRVVIGGVLPPRGATMFERGKA
jgi:Enoyl-(Acyl carrier protein) reductase/Proline racemase